MHADQMKAKVQKGLRFAGNKISDFFNMIFCRELPFAGQLLELAAIKYLYIFLVIFLLKDQYYQGHGSYGVDFVPWKECVAAVVFLAVAAIYLRFPIKGRFPQWIMHILFVLYYIPLNSAFALNDTTWGFFILSNLYFILLMAAVYWAVRLLDGKLSFLQPKGVDNRGSCQEKAVGLFCLAVCCLFIIHKLDYNGLDFSLSGIYVNRAEYAAYLQSISGTVFAYLLAIVRYVVAYVVPFFVVVSLVKKKPVMFVIACLAALSMFAVSSEKGKLMMPVIAIGIYICYKLKLLNNFRRVFTVGIIALLVFCLAEVLVRGESSVFRLIVRREMYFPAWLNTMYYDFFNRNDKIMWTQSVFLLQNVFEPVYTVSPLELISDIYFAGKMPSPNTGLFAEAYMHFGAVGVLVYPVILSAVILVSGKVLKAYGIAVQALLAFQMVLSLTNVPATRTDFVLSCLFFVAVLWLLPGIASKLSNLIRRTGKKVRVIKLRKSKK